MIQKTNYLVVLDVETGGLDETKNPITEVAFIVLNGLNYKLVDQYQTYVMPYAGLEVTSRALEASRVTIQQISKGKKIEVVVKEVIEKINGLGKRQNKPLLIGHNINFDKRFLNHALGFFQKSVDDYFYETSIDTMVMMKRSEIGRLKASEITKYNLGACCERMNIRLREAHGAMADVRATAELFINLDQRLRTKENGGFSENGNNKIVSEKSRKFFDFCD